MQSEEDRYKEILKCREDLDDLAREILFEESVLISVICNEDVALKKEMVVKGINEVLSNAIIKDNKTGQKIKVAVVLVSEGLQQNEKLIKKISYFFKTEIPVLSYYLEKKAKVELLSNIFPEGYKVKKWDKETFKNDYIKRTTFKQVTRKNNDIKEDSVESGE